MALVRRIVKVAAGGSCPTTIPLEAFTMKKFAIFAALCSLTLFTAGCDNSPAAKKAAGEKQAIKAAGDEMKADIDAEAKDEKADVDDAVKEADETVDAEKKAEEADSK
jgi:outer membrane murein-binding lipoprotein Lpp